MSDLGKAIYMAASILLFIVAATASLFLYGTLSEYLNTSTHSINMNNRVEGAVIDKSLSSKRVITNSEVIITLYNMKQMHVDTLEIRSGGKTYSVDKEDVIDNELKDFLKDYHEYSYACNGAKAIYAVIK